MSDTNIQFVGFSKVIVKAEPYGASAELYLEDVPVVPPVVVPTDLKLYTSHNIQALAFSVEKADVAVGEQVWFHFTVTNIGTDPVGIGILAARAETNIAAQSYTDYTLQAGQSITDWRDHILLPAGTHKLYLGLGFDKNACLAFTQPWYRLSDSLTVTVK